MPYDLFLALTVFAIVMSFTPGPNNILLTASGVNFGFVRSIPHMLGVEVGFLVLVVACAAGLGLIFAALPGLHIVLKVAGAVYMLWLAWKVANAKPAGEEGGLLARPMTFLQAAAFQWMNPKAVIAALSAIALYMRPGHEVFDLAVMLIVFGVSTILAVATWAGFGVALRRYLRDPVHARVFNAAMGALLVVSIAPMVA
ncbi:MAG TPA: LysE family translocator [Pseudolabrys sp.]|jgi:threonine/homoserine/homoserine lactone efflux protein|nr:LysE family translocator [Pseudolabrys sp.]